MKRGADRSITRKINFYIAFLVLFAMTISIVMINRGVTSDRQRALVKYANQLLESSMFAKDELITRLLLGHKDAILQFKEKVKQEERLEGISVVGVKTSAENFLVPCNYTESGYCYDNKTYILYTIYPLKYGDRDFGVLVKSKKIEIGDEWKSYLLSNIMLSVVLIVFLPTFLGLYIRRNLVNPCNEIIKSMEPITRGEFDVRFPEPCNLEVKGLTRGIMKLIDDIKNYQRIYNKNTRLAAIGQSASMIAHDVRKPFASMKSLLGMIPDKKDDPAFVNYVVSLVCAPRAGTIGLKN